ncbi:MAG: helix-turn-helix domain-containing protein [Gammaproteobacteria bacterium]|nr:helix-turn-helix domain-containing protein [Gammaproteobacteria bacterium]MDH3464916.1 helix-turn-helix domain-containing protein [Gammaproteobacteria bacterium]
MNPASLEAVLKWLRILFGVVRSAIRPRQELALENLALRQQLAVLKHRYPRPRLQDSTRLFWVYLIRVLKNWRISLRILQPATVVRWHRQGFKYYWPWKSRGREHPKIDPEIRDLIQRMCNTNPLWGAPQIQGELLKLGFEISEATVSKYMIRRHGPPSQTWRIFFSIVQRKRYHSTSSRYQPRHSRSYSCSWCSAMTEDVSSILM